MIQFLVDFFVIGYSAKYKNLLKLNRKLPFVNLVYIFFSQEPKDLTLDAGSRGVAVVDATLVKINSALKKAKEDLKNDFGFLKRIALVESNFGEANLAHPNGGIWQVGESLFCKLHCHVPYITLYNSTK